MNRPTPDGLLLVAAVDGAVGMTATGTTAAAASSAALLLGWVTNAVVLEVDNSGTVNGEEERWTGGFSGAGKLDWLEFSFDGL